MALPAGWEFQPSPLHQGQVVQLLEPVNPTRVHVGQKNRLNMESYDIRAHLNRIFGFGAWSGDVLQSTVILERTTRERLEEDGEGEPTGQFRISVGYRVRYRLTVYAWQQRYDESASWLERLELATYTEEATGDALNFPLQSAADAHDFAVKTAESQALKRAAINLGDQFGLSLYNSGEQAYAPLVKSALAGRDYTKIGVERVEDAQSALVAPEAEGSADDYVSPPTERQSSAADFIAAAGAAESESAWDRLYAAARAAKHTPATLEAMKDARSYV